MKIFSNWILRQDVNSKYFQKLQNSAVFFWTRHGGSVYSTNLTSEHRVKNFTHSDLTLFFNHTRFYLTGIPKEKYSLNQFIFLWLWFEDNGERHFRPILISFALFFVPTRSQRRFRQFQTTVKGTIWKLFDSICGRGRKGTFRLIFSSSRCCCSVFNH